MTTPVHERAEAGASVGGLLSTSGVVRFRQLFSTEQSAAQYNDWANNPIGRTVVAALRDMALNGPASKDAESLAVQYGITLGLGMAANLITDPSSVYPEMFANPVQQALPSAADFSVSPYEALDQIGD